MLKGSCLCGRVKYEADAELGPIVVCHCSRCRKASGTAVTTNAPVPAQAFRLTSGSDSLSEWESSPGLFRVFCRTCGSPLYSRRLATEIVRLRIGTLDTPIDVRPVHHIFVASKAEWDEIHDELPQHAERA